MYVVRWGARALKGLGKELRTDPLFFFFPPSLQAINELQKNGMNMSFSFLNYAQSSQCRNWQDSSVSYAAGALMVH